MGASPIALPILLGAVGGALGSVYGFGISLARRWRLGRGKSLLCGAGLAGGLLMVLPTKIYSLFAMLVYSLFMSRRMVTIQLRHFFNPSFEVSASLLAGACMGLLVLLICSSLPFLASVSQIEPQRGSEEFDRLLE
jgi:hypothetical protein